jgi:hypothetical protein
LLVLAAILMLVQSTIYVVPHYAMFSSVFYTTTSR